MTDRVVPLNQPLPGEELARIELFRERFRELWSNWGSLKSAGIKLGGSFSNLGGGKVSGPGCGIEVHRLKGFYLDFRPFYAEKEPTHYFGVASLIGRHCADDGLRECLRSNKKDWNDAGFLHEWHGVTPDEMTDVLFNGELFHSDLQKRERWLYVQCLMSDDLAHHCLVCSIFSRMLVVRNLNWILQPLMSERQMIRVPSEFAQQSHPADARTPRG